mgnify:CR=1 FL=1
MRKLMLAAAVAVGGLAVQATPATYDEIGGLRPSGGQDVLWRTSGHAGVSIDVATSDDSTSVERLGGDERRVSQSLAGFDPRWCTFGETFCPDFDSFAPGYLLFLR